MKRFLRLGLVGLAVVAGSVFGVTSFSGTANAQIAAIGKTCTAGAPNTANCLITFPAVTTLAAGQSITVTITAPLLTATFISATPNVTGGPAATVVAPGGGAYTVTCAVACNITSIAEVVGNVPAGTTLQQAITFNGPGATTVGAAAVPAGTVAALPAVTIPAGAGITTGAGLPAGTTKTCSTAVPAPGSALTTINVPAGVASPVIVTVTNATVVGTPTVAPAGVGAVTGGLGTNTFTVTCSTALGSGIATAAGQACPAAFQITENLTAGAGLGTVITETFSAGGGPAVAITPTNAPITITAAGAQFVTTISLTGCVAATAIAAPVAGGTNIPAGTAVATSFTTGQAVTCRINLDDNESAAIALTGATGSLVSSGIVAVTVNTPVTVGTISNVAPNIGGIISQTGNTTTVRCGAAPSGANNVNGCDFVDVTFTPAQTGSVVAGLPLQVVINVTYTPDIPAQNTSAQGQFAAFSLGIAISTFVQPTGFFFSCPASLNVNLTSNGNAFFNNVFNGLPGQLGGVSVAGVGVLPAALVCQAIPTVGGINAGTTTVVGVAPGTIEISSVNGTLLDANGNITTNLRIACGGASSNFSTSGVTNPNILFGLNGINPNTCTGVNFAVLGLGVGFVEIRARYEPTATAILAGIIEIEAASSVAFIAPPVTLSLTLNPSTVTAFNAGGTVIASADPSGLSAVPGAPCIIAAAGATAPAATSCGVATLTFLGSVITFNGGAGTNIYVNPTNGTFLRNPNGSVLNGNVIFSSSDDSVARFVLTGSTAGTFTVAGAPNTVGSSTGNQLIVRCGTPFNAQTGVNPGIGSNFGTFFGGCNTASVAYQGVNPGAANITATFIADLPGAFGTLGSSIAGSASTNAINSSVFNLLGGFASFGGTGNVSTSATLTVLASLPSSSQTVALVRGCNNVSPTVSESATAYAARVTASSALVSIFEYQPATNSFRGFSPAPGAPSDLAAVTRLRPVFVCVNAAATLAQPAI